MRKRWWWIGLLFALAVRLEAQTSTAVETLGVVPAPQVSSGLGFNIDAPGFTQDFQFAAVKAAGGSYVRIQCVWASVEQQSPAPNNVPASTQYIQTPACVSALTSAKRYGLNVTINAAYGPPWHETMQLQLASAGSVGDTVLHVVFLAGDGGLTLANLAYPYDYIADLTTQHTAPYYGAISTKGGYPGVIVASVSLTDSTHADVTLASALKVAIPTSHTLQVNRVLYPPAATTSPTDPSVIAFDNYVSFLAADMASRGITGDAEVYNEPPGSGTDSWDNPYNDYDSPNCTPTCASPGPANAGTPNYGFVADLQGRTFPSGVTVTWNGTSGNGFASILASSMHANTGVYANQPANVVTRESFHPYGGTYNSPEDFMWTTACLQATAAATSYPANNYGQCLLEDTSANAAYEAQLDMKAKLSNAAYGVGRSITESNMATFAAGLKTRQALFNLRQYIAGSALGYWPIEFFQLWDGTHNDPTFSFIDYDGTSVIPLPSYTALQGLMTDLAAIKSAPPVTYSSATLPAPLSFSGTYPLDVVHVVGATAGAIANSDMMFLWQRSNCTTAGCWTTLASPSAASATITLPANMAVTSAIDLMTRTSVAFTVSGQNVTLPVTENPLEVLVSPITLAVTHRTYGASTRSGNMTVY